MGWRKRYVWMLSLHRDVQISNRFASEYLIVLEHLLDSGLHSTRLMKWLVKEPFFNFNWNVFTNKGMCCFQQVFSKFPGVVFEFLRIFSLKYCWENFQNPKTILPNWENTIPSDKPKLKVPSLVSTELCHSHHFFRSHHVVNNSGGVPQCTIEAPRGSKDSDNPRWYHPKTNGFMFLAAVWVPAAKRPPWNTAAVSGDHVLVRILRTRSVTNVSPAINIRRSDQSCQMERGGVLAVSSLICCILLRGNRWSELVETTLPNWEWDFATLQQHCRNFSKETCASNAYSYFNHKILFYFMI